MKFAELMHTFGSARAAAESLAINEAHRDVVAREMERAARLGIIYLSDDDPRYPENMRAIKNHPPILTASGNLSALARPAVAMVGTRHATGAGMKFISELAEEFVQHGHVVVSGMAMGTDTAAHAGALRAKGDAVTIAVLAGGADYIWPPENESLYRQITERGAVLSEMPVAMAPLASHFIQRNRWIAGICDKFILGEADLKSGSMTTARFAIEYKKPVFAIPSHPSDPRAAGPNKLIAEGLATLCCGAKDFFDGTESKNRVPSAIGKKDENDILDRLGIIPLSESVLAELAKKSIAEIKRNLVILELRGKVRKQDGGYVRN